jgi:predicted lysophospholipase L1 biosynthesis ABC-type transport system permease subunit
MSGQVAAGQRNHFTGRRSGLETKADYQRFPTVREIRVRQMIEAVAAILGLLSASVFLAHAVDAYRSL